MKTTANSQSGYISLILVFVSVIIFLFAMGAQGIYTAVRNRKPVVMSCREPLGMVRVRVWPRLSERVRVPDVTVKTFILVKILVAGEKVKVRDVPTAESKKIWLVESTSNGPSHRRGRAR